MRAFLASLAIIGSAGCSVATDGAGLIPPNSPLAVSDRQETMPYGQAVTGQISFDMAGPPVPLETLASTCRRPTARSGAKAAYVYSYGGDVHVPLHHVNFKDTPEEAEARRAIIKAAMQGQQQSAFSKEFANFTAGNEVEWASRIDVLVTETEAPVFLYLSSYDPILWNIQLAPGASLDGVVVNSYDAGAIANGTDPKRTAIISSANWPGGKCYAKAPTRAIPVADRIAAARKINPDFDPGPHRRQWEQDYRDGQKFDTVVRQLIGKRPDWIITKSADGYGVKAVLVGPKPAAPFALQPITRLQIPEHITPFWGTRKGAFSAFGLEHMT